MDEHTDAWRQYYEKALNRPHLKRTELAIQLDESDHKVAIDCGCGTGSDLQYLKQQGYTAYGFDVNPEAVKLCQQRFQEDTDIKVTESSFERFHYPEAGIIMANSSLFFADPSQFDTAWRHITSSLRTGGVFAGDFMGLKDSWAQKKPQPDDAIVGRHRTSALRRL
ncbi:class I SAM-dependent methyltransferase [Reinekea blandensis]|uniref:SAM-dependent methyltransferase n=1 Tax=Reinekea blandensis MED297 TaxID=314283 RepID=A4BFB4_9GAMM|nr:class I SAM-dependent methyltransferase [Reinekea blandensis]EAR09227.1 SAM-dependent methyltransferase [Reinekea sp. MED297] [Reinekea blandensis MED297]